MTLRYLYNGVEQTNTATRIKGPISVITSRADGSTASGEAVIKDPYGTLGYDMLREFRVIEDSCVSAPVQHIGMIYNLRVSRGEYVTGVSREWTFEFTDLNGLLKERVLYHSADKRPKESGNARIAWLLASHALAGLVYDNGQIGNLTDAFDEADYRGRYADDVLQDLMASSFADDNKIYFVYYDQVAHQPSLYLHTVTATTHDSPLRISNDPADYDGVTTFRPVPGPEAELAGEEIYDGVYFTTKDGSIYRQRAATFAAYGRHRDGTFSTDRITLGDTAERHAQMWLNLHSVRRDTITCTVRVPRDKVGLIQAGDRIWAKFLHLPPPYDAGTYLRVQARSFPVVEGFISHYDLTLELSNRGLFASGSGSGVVATYPKQPGAGAIVQSNFGLGTRTFPTAPTDGNGLILAIGDRGGPLVTPTGYTALPIGSMSDGTDVVGIFSKVASGDTATLFDADTDHALGWWEAAGVDTTPSAYVENSGSGTAISAAAVTVGKGDLIVMAAITGSGGGFDADAGFNASWTPGAGFIEDFDSKVGSGHPATLFAHQIAAAAGSITPTATFNDRGTGPWPWAIQVAVFPALAGDDPPLAGQRIENEIPTPAPDGVTKTFTVANAYVPLSLKVKVDGVPILNGITETDPDNGTFTLDFAPKGAIGDARAEIVTVDYQAV